MASYPLMPDILLATLNARYIHAAFGLRYLHANLGPLQDRAAIAEFDINQRPLEIAERILALNPRIVGLGIYIWNAAPALELVRLLKTIRPGLILVLGGPEVSYEVEKQEICTWADYVITGEADLTFRDLCEALLGENPPKERVIAAPLPDVTQLQMPYALYNDQDVSHRIVYVEASRGCPFRCEFCLSSLDIPVRQFPLEPFLQQMQSLLDRGLNQFKFVDRTFNLSIPVSLAILRFFLARMRPGLFVHFEMVPDRLPEELRSIIREFPAGCLQFEVGIQTFHPEVATRISRRQNYTKLEENLRFLRKETGVHIHADLIAGLPGEDLESFAAGFDRLVALDPHEIQLGILKKLRGTPIGRHDAEWGAVFSPMAPYEILQNRLIPFESMQELKRFARYWDLVVNSGNFTRTAALLWEGASPFTAFQEFARWLHGKTGRTSGTSLMHLFEYLFEYLGNRHDRQRVATLLLEDYRGGGRSDTPPALRPFLPTELQPGGRPPAPALPKRQARRVPA